MNKFLFFTVFIAIVAMCLLSSCSRYNELDTFEEVDKSKQFVEAMEDCTWTPFLSDSIKNNLLSYFELLSADSCFSLSKKDVLIHKKLGVSIPDSLMEVIPAYYKAFVSKKTVILEKRDTIVSKPTLWKSAKIKFELKIVNFETFEQTDVVFVERNLRLLYQIVIWIVFVLILLFFTWTPELMNGIVICVGIFIVLLLLWAFTFYYSPLIVSIVLGLCGIMFVIWHLIIRPHLLKKGVLKEPSDIEFSDVVS
ncbi:MAG TPA: hypothetical protein P5060_00430 [Candidatus Absconditabacterales bacterium]|nr:hypothetical protein [Candidatus Absconditabacterales bacterium]